MYSLIGNEVIIDFKPEPLFRIIKYLLQKVNTFRITRKLEVTSRLWQILTCDHWKLSPGLAPNVFFNGKATSNVHKLGLLKLASKLKKHS